MDADSAPDEARLPLVAESTEGKTEEGSVAARERAAALIGRTISDRYKILDLLAMGGMGAVYRAEHLLMRKHVAVKVLHARTAGFPELVERFERECGDRAFGADDGVAVLVGTNRRAIPRDAGEPQHQVA